MVDQHLIKTLYVGFSSKLSPHLYKIINQQLGEKKTSKRLLVQSNWKLCLHTLAAVD